jgi:hypothetical protein
VIGEEHAMVAWVSIKNSWKDFVNIKPHEVLILFFILS